MKFVTAPYHPFLLLDKMIVPGNTIHSVSELMLSTRK
jgi:hypothetical protein